MRWDVLFEDLEGQLAAERLGQRRDQVADLERAEAAGVRLVDRLRSRREGEVVLQPVSGEPVRGVVVELGEDWVLLAQGPRHHLLPLHAVVWVGGLGVRAAGDPVRLRRGLGLGHALRALSRDRLSVAVRTPAGELLGRLDWVGSDHVDLTPVRPGQVAGLRSGDVRSIPLTAIHVVSEL